MKVLMLGWELPPHNSGGLGVACYQLCKTMAGNDIDIEFVLPYQAEHQNKFMTITAAINRTAPHIVPGLSAYDSAAYVTEDGRIVGGDIYSQQLAYEHAVAQLAYSRQFDIVHAHDWLTFRAALRLKQLCDVPIVLHVHSVESDRAGGQPGNPLVREIESTALQLADHIIAVSEHTKRAIVRDYGIPAEDIEVVHNSINPGDLEPLDCDNAYTYLEALKLQGYKVVTSIGRLTVQKGLPNLLRAAKEVVAMAPKTIFLIVGSGEQYHELIALAAELGIGKNVLFVGFQRGKRWRDAYAIADLFVLPSVSEPFGLTPLEAVGYGTPVLLSKQSGVSEVLRNALRVDYWDVREMANQIIAAVQNDSLTYELSRQAALEYQRLSWHDAARRIKQIYAAKLNEVPA